MRRIIWFFLPLFSLMIFGCEDSEETTTDTANGDTTQTSNTNDTGPWEQNGIRLSEFTDFNEVSGVSIELEEPQDLSNIQPGEHTFRFNVEGFELGLVTEGAEETGLANSADGQHIHFILNNKPYMAHYEPEFTETLGAEDFVMLAFPSRSYHLSVKGPYVLEAFSTNGGGNENFDVDAPHVFYSRPKGEYSGADAQKILLDFYLVNTDLSEDGHKVRVTVNGNAQFTLTNWAPYVLEGLPDGKNTIKLELLDENDNLVDSPINPVEREITVSGGNAQAQAMQH